MTKAKKTVLSLAIAAAMGGAVSSAHAVNLATDNLGDVLLFPYYTARNGWNSLIHIINTSSVATVALKVRFQEAQNTRDVLDFTLVLSPNDEWTGYVTNTDGGPRLKKSSGETSCTSPTQPAGGWAFSTFGYGGTDLTRAEEGHLTVIQMGHALAGTAIDTAAKAKDCATIDAAFTKANINTTSNQFGEPINSLKGQYSLVRVDAGLSMGGSPVVLANFFTPNMAYPAGVVDGATAAAAGGFTGNYGVTNLIAAQEYPDFLLPTLNDAVPSVSMVQDDTSISLQQTLVDTGWTNPVDAVSAVLMRSNVINDWSINPALGVESYWVISFPTKLHYVDANAQPTAAEIAAMVGGGPAAANPAYVGPPPAPFSTTWTDANRSCDTVTFQLYDRSEGSVSATGTSISPAPPIPPKALCNEVNVLSFSPTANLLGSAVAQAIDVSGLVSKQPYGWMNVVLPAGQLVGPTNTYVGLPATGFVLWSRDFGNAANNYGHVVDHGYRRTVQ